MCPPSSENGRMFLFLMVPSLLAFLYYSSASGDDTQRIGYLLLKMAMTDFTIAFFCFFIYVA